MQGEAGKGDSEREPYGNPVEVCSFNACRNERAMRLLTERLTLRPPEDGDIDALTSFFRDRAQAGPELGVPPSRNEALARAAFFKVDADQLWAEHGHGPLVMLHREALVGVCGLRPAPDGPRPSDLGPREPVPPLLFYGVALPFRRFGLGEEAARACLALGFAHLDFPRIDAAAREDNRASIGMLAKLGFEKVGFRRVFGAHLLAFKCSAPAAAAASAA